MTDIIIILTSLAAAVFMLFIAARARVIRVALVAFYPDGRAVIAGKIADLAEGVMLFRSGNSVILFHTNHPPVRFTPTLYVYFAVAERLVANLAVGKELRPHDAALHTLYRYVVKCDADETTCIKRLVESIRGRTALESGVVFSFDSVDVALSVDINSIVNYYMYKEEINAAITHEVISAMMRISENSKMLMKTLTAVTRVSSAWIWALIAGGVVFMVLFAAFGPQLTQLVQHAVPALPVPRP